MVHRSPPPRAREAVAPYGTDEPERPRPQAAAVYHVTVTDRGRLVLPAEIRSHLKIRDGDSVAVTVEQNGTISLTTPSVAIGQLRGMFRRIAPTGHFASDDVIAGRRLEAQTENPEKHRRSSRGRIKPRRWTAAPRSPCSTPRLWWHFSTTSPGAGRVEAVLRRGVLMSAVNWSEVLADLAERGEAVEVSASRVRRSIDKLGTVELVPFDEDHARETARLRVITRSSGLSLADRACLALCRVHHLPALTTDRAWRRLRQLSIRIVVIR